MGDAPIIKPGTSKADVQHTMNVAIGSTRWYGSASKDLRWGNLLQARNQFVEYHLRQHMSIEQYKSLQLDDKQRLVEQLRQVFTNEFFEYTRDSGWKQEALGENPNWLYIEGMATWHIKAAIYSLQTVHGHREVMKTEAQHTGM